MQGPRDRVGPRGGDAPVPLILNKNILGERLVVMFTAAQRSDGPSTRSLRLGIERPGTLFGSVVPRTSVEHFWPKEQEIIDSKDRILEK